MLELHRRSCFLRKYLYNNKDDEELNLLTTNNALRFSRLLFRLYDVNTPQENYKILSEIANNPKNIKTVCSELVPLGQGLGYFTDKKHFESKYITKEDFLLIIQQFLMIVKEHYSSIKDMNDVRNIVIFVKEFNEDLANEILTNRLKSNKNFIEFLHLFYSSGYSFGRSGYPRKENYGISIKGLEYHFKIQDIEERLNAIIKSTQNTGLKSKASLLFSLFFLFR